MRSFIAIKITPENKLLDVFSTFKKSLSGEAINWVSDNNLHLTLRFLGETTQEQVAEIINLLELTCKHIQPFQFELKGVAVFKNKIQPRVLFLSIEDDFRLKQLAANIEEKITSLGFSHEEKAFNPHLTLGRIKFIQEKDVLYSLVNKYKSTYIQQVTVSEIIFYQSILGLYRSTYNPIKITKLKKS
jgi:RNA 2',3'-cyclic 3'-phosphodiesterase